MTWVQSVAGFVILMSGLVTPASAQSTADIAGRVTDPGGGALVGATTSTGWKRLPHELGRRVYDHRIDTPDRSAILLQLI
jgi:hypothetical protein